MDLKQVFDLIVALCIAVTAIAGAYQAKIKFDHWRERAVLRAAQKLERQRLRAFDYPAIKNDRCEPGKGILQ